MLARPKLQDAETETLSEGINPMLARPKSALPHAATRLGHQSHAREPEMFLLLFLICHTVINPTLARPKS